MYLFINLMTGISLSLDAFSLAIIYGTLIRDKKLIFLISLVVGIFHFFMPLSGFTLSNLFHVNDIPHTNILSFIIFLVLGLEMIFDKFDDKKVSLLNSIYSILLFALTVSIDSFSVGIVLSSNNSSILIPIIIFSVTSFIFTYVGLILGKKLNSIFSKYTSVIGGIILILLSIKYLLT